MTNMEQFIADLNAANLQVVTQVNGRNVTRGELQEAFNRVVPLDNWKNRIDATIDAESDEELMVIAEAVTFFTGSVAEFERVGSLATPGLVGFSIMGARVRVRAAGYYAAVGA